MTNEQLKSLFELIDVFDEENKSFSKLRLVEEDVKECWMEFDADKYTIEYWIRFDVGHNTVAGWHSCKEFMDYEDVYQIIKGKYIDEYRQSQKNKLEGDVRFHTTELEKAKDRLNALL